ncbi:SDR family NAD(P)-dependent oxidoreductase [Acidaminococcus intestini]|jgi:NAD(P)-dependent dehydrogenase (short-subunit alcohol dehydrogenase family)|uniref:SDR family NAD(P)-dependent oxidoreductase n=1 Tax=Acidaminococcus intestini TaxID=187327 RepID=UPI0026DADEAF|nr:SDR family NAD(P)-dependent oxidoreductase [Acidaminococcus intestini]
MERVWFITGASRGFGRAFTEEAVKRGDKVIATVRRVPHDDIFKHPSVLTVVMDVTKTDEVEKAIKDGMNRFGRIDVLINNAGFGFSGAFEETTDEDLRNLFETDYFGVVNVTRRVIPLMRKAGKGVILNVSSQGGLMGFSGSSAYCAAKFAVVGLSDMVEKGNLPPRILIGAACCRAMKARYEAELKDIASYEAAASKTDFEE